MPTTAYLHFKASPERTWGMNFGQAGSPGLWVHSWPSNGWARPAGKKHSLSLSFKCIRLRMNISDPQEFLPNTGARPTSLFLCNAFFSKKCSNLSYKFTSKKIIPSKLHHHYATILLFLICFKNKTNIQPFHIRYFLYVLFQNMRSFFLITFFFFKPIN